jgi:SEC-C motif
MASWDAATCWQKLEEFCKKNKDKEDVNEVKLDHAERIVEALARFGKASEERVRAILSEKIEDYTHSPMKWLEPLVVRLAGQAHLDSTIPLLIGKLHEDADLLDEECAKALAQIGTAAVLEAVAEAFPSGEDHFRIYACNPLEHIHSDLAVEKALTLLRQEKALNIQQILAQALLSQFAHEGIEATRQLLLGRKLDYEGKGLRNYLVETCTIMGERFPEYDEWLATEKKEKEEHWKRVKELEGDPKGLLVYALEKITGKKAADVMKAKPSVAPVPRLALPRKPQGQAKVGRNDPCPCGSGKKFKNCCMRKQGEF